MSKIEWHKTGERRYETGTSHGVLYLRDAEGAYTNGVPWNGLTAVTESPSGAEANPQYADNMKYLNLISLEEFSATIEAFTYPEEFERCDGSASIAPGVHIGQQNRETFGLSYQTLVGNEIKGTDHGKKIHLVYGCLAAPSERAYATVNDSPEAMTFSWELSTTAVNVPGFKPSATMTFDSTKLDPAVMTALEDVLYGTEADEPRLPLPDELISILSLNTEPASMMSFGAPESDTPAYDPADGEAV